MESSLRFDLRALEVVAAVCELHSMTLAGRRLGMTQSAVSQAIRHLEASLGVAIVDRKRRPLTPTTAGSWLAAAAGRILRDARQIPVAMRHLESGKVLQLRIGLVDSLSSPFVPDLVEKLKSSIRYLSVSAGLARGLRAGLIEHDLDLIIINDRMDGIDGLFRHLILVEPYIVVVPRAFDPGREKIGLAELGRRLPLIRWDPRSHIAADIEINLRRMRIEVPRRFEFDSPDLILAMVGAELGWAIVTPLSIFEVKARLPKVRTMPVTGAAFSRRLDLVSRAGEIDALAGRIAALSCRIIRRSYLPEILRLAPWLDGKVLIGGSDDTSASG